jgi:manganese transport protein
MMRRAITMVPALVVIALGVNPTETLVISQVVLSFGIPFALVPLVIHSRNVEVMRELVTGRLVNAASYLVVGLIVALNVFLISQTVLGAAG